MKALLEILLATMVYNYSRVEVGKYYQNNSQNQFLSENWMSVILDSQMLQTLCKPEIAKNLFAEGQNL